MSKKLQILEMLRAAKDRTLTIRQFIEYDAMIYHKLASRLSDLKSQGYVVRYIPSTTQAWIDASYRLEYDKDNDKDEQMRFC